MKERTILHYDMDAFYASVEIRDNPSLKGKPMVVGGTVITTASYEARKFGVRSAMSVMEARKLCPNLVVVPVSMGKYLEISSKIKNLVLKLTDKVEFIASDEGYVDITEIIKKYPSKEYFALRFQRGIYENTGLTCSVGIGYNKLSAKIASDVKKPAGYHIFNDSKEFVKFIGEKNIKIIPGVGKKFQEILAEKNILTVGDVHNFSVYELISYFGKSRGEFLYCSSKGEDNRQVDYKRRVHSVGNESTFKYPLESEIEIKRELENIFHKTHERLVGKGLLCKTLTLKVRFENRRTITRSKTLENFVDSREILENTLENINESVDYSMKVKLLGISLGALTQKSVRQLSFSERELFKKKNSVDLLKEKIKKIEKND
ncbi:DNA polymerase IV [uncultured Ilyobacter sp.]|uniref:DNA polymerase IV n=1 Tax=uncultured Ilyobacter sp. TaxID=544433 RepID=UPI0029C6BB67|nr:DNA polymerase IV [uncultured Ilyobacter sp.]